VLNLADFGRIRVLADSLGVETIDREGSTVAIKFRQKARVDPMHLINLVQERGDLKLIPPSTVRLDLKYRDPGSGIRDLGSGIADAKSPLQRANELRKGARIPKIQRKPAWWTARATTGEVTPGFTKAEILKQAPEDPRAPDGVLVKVTDLLEDLHS
jgi:hypothetical protein